MSERLKIADLKFDPQNARVRTAKGEAMIQESLRSVGAARSIVIDEDGTILAGNGTVEAAGQVGIENVLIVEASGDEIIAVKRVGLTDEQKKKLAYYDNRTGDEAEWDMEQVARDLLGGYDFLDELFENIEVPAPEKEGTDKLPEDPAEVLRDKWGVEYGDLWQIGPHRILCGDSTKKEDVDRLLDGAKAGAIITDPPYGMEAVEKSGVLSQRYKPVHGDGDTKIAKDAINVFRDVPQQIWWGANYYVDALRPASCWLVWDKNNGGSDQMDAELAWTNLSGVTRMFTKASERGAGRYHPTQKPASLYEWCMSKTDGIVIDVFAGSGPCLVAAHNLSRTCYAMEIDPAYVAVCIERMAQLGYDPDKVENLEG